MDQDVVKRRILKLIDRKGLCAMVHGMTEDGKPARGTLPVVASLYNVSRQCAHKIFKEVRSRIKEHDNDNDTDCINNPTLAPDELCNNNTFKRCAGKLKHCRAAAKASVKAIPLADRRRYRHLAAKINIPTTTIWRMVKQEKPLFRHTSNLKPKLTATHQHLRMLHCLERIDSRTINSRTQSMKFVDQFDEAHVDEKWFFVCNDGESYVLVADEEEPPKRAVGHKSHIVKAMFTSAIAKPRRLANGTWWDGKIGIWLIGRLKHAQRVSVNRPVGAPEWEPKLLTKLSTNVCC